MARRKSSPNKSNNLERAESSSLFISDMWALGGGVLAAVIALVGQWFIGRIYNGEQAQYLLQAINNSALWLGGSVVTASATILALMLTMLSLSDQTKIDFDRVFFRRIEQIGVMTTISLASGILLLLFLSIPLQESKNVPNQSFTVIYYILITFLALLAGLLITVVLMLLNAIRSLIEGVRPDDIDDEKTDK
ncbi:MAG: hypothetical protein WA584_04330 [Pyrinomonadaceae bacterium]